MSDFKEIKNSINFMCKNGQNRSDIILLQCTSHYPTKPKDVNLNVMTNLKKN